MLGIDSIKLFLHPFMSDEPDPKTHTICLVEGLAYVPEILPAIERQYQTQHRVHLIDCTNIKGVLVALHKDDARMLDQDSMFYWDNTAYVFAPFNLRWADATTRLIFRRWMSK
jgi:hypothetical protein